MRILAAAALLASLSCSPGRSPEPNRALQGAAAPEAQPRAKARGSVPEAAPVPSEPITNNQEPITPPPSPPPPSPPPQPITNNQEPTTSHVPGVACVALQPLGPVPQEYIDAAAAGLRELYGFEVRILEPVDLPESAWYEPRQRWRAEKLNDFLRDRVPEGCDRIAGLTTQDISTTKGDLEDWGILGLADMPGTAAVLSTFRCRRKVHDVSPVERFRRVAVHEVGHTLGLPHCPTYGCFLEDAGGKAETIDRETFLCDVCRERLGWVE